RRRPFPVDVMPHQPCACVYPRRAAVVQPPNFRLEKSPFRGYISSDRREALLRLARPLFG
ncbi:MAG: hypothetical protein VX013_07820, partial [Pseudomonadota bacterium]|nr:hypothetical protein [Pseudomonadota bacterium]MEC8270103.1 hypothetical protein [Pseudomonadota bacterium]